MDRFFSALKQSLESHTRRLKKGRAFLPSHLKNGRFTKKALPPVVKELSKRLRLLLREEVRNPFPPSLEMWLPYQRVDYVLGPENRPKHFFEVESLDRAQLYLFLPHGGRSDESKLWYYWATVCKLIRGDMPMPRYFVWLLILPDQPVGPYPNWDCGRPYRLFDPKLTPLIRDNPFSFYDPIIKASARRFLQRKEWICSKDGSWTKKRLANFQDRCELVFITCTGRQLIMSRGKYLFDPAKELRATLKWQYEKKAASKGESK